MEIDIDELKRLAKAATRLPWTQWAGHAEVFAGTIKENTRGHLLGGIGQVCECSDDLCAYDGDDCCNHSGEDEDGEPLSCNPWANAAYIVAACNALPALIERLERAETAWQHTVDRQEIERLKAELAALREHVRWVPVGEQLPILESEHDAAKFSVVCDGEISTAWFGLYEPLFDTQHFGWHRQDDFGPLPVTHWRPLGALPEVKE